MPQSSIGMTQVCASRTPPPMIRPFPAFENASAACIRLTIVEITPRLIHDNLRNKPGCTAIKTGHVYSKVFLGSAIVNFPRKRKIPEQPNKNSHGYPLRLLMFMAVAMVMSVAGGCGTTGPANDSDEQIQLVYQDWRTDWFPGMAQEMLDEFHASHPNIRVFYTPDPDDVEGSMLADMKAGTAPDVFQGCCSYFPIWF